ncbi:MAG: hypothetical protein NZ604_07420, partial [Flavobacteriales bacterium]|nr:hypothetical protein [Flavobacteriales bacterium]
MKKYFIVLASVIFTGLNAQNIHTGYYSNAFILQSASNPAAFPEANTVVGFPGLSNLNYGLQWPFSLNEVFQKGLDDSLRINLPSIISNMGKKDVLHL